jgi:hypothetical protein
MTENNDPKQGTPLDPDGPYADEQDVQFGQAAKNKEEELDQAIAEGRPCPKTPKPSGQAARPNPAPTPRLNRQSRPPANRDPLTALQHKTASYRHGAYRACASGSVTVPFETAIHSSIGR